MNQEQIKECQHKQGLTGSNGVYHCKKCGHAVSLQEMFNLRLGEKKTKILKFLTGLIFKV